MRNFLINLTDNKKDIFSGHINYGGVNSQGDKISFTNYYMELNGVPFSEFRGSSILVAIIECFGKMK